MSSPEKNETFVTKPDHFTASVIIPAYNCEKTIAQTIEALLKQTYPLKEIIVVDDGSTDRTLTVIRGFAQVTFLHQSNSGPASARNRGANVANSDIIFFTDSDCIPHADWVERSMAHFKDPMIGAVAGSYGIANAKAPLAGFIQKEISFRHMHLMPEYVKCFGSYNVAIRKRLFHELGGFNENYRRASGEDNDLSYKILKGGHRIYFSKQSLVDHYHTTEVSKYLKEQYRHGVWRVKMYCDHPQMMQGDDYTFWKDILEVPWVYSSIVLLVLSLGLNPIWPKILLSSLLIMLVFEIGFAFWILKNVFDSLSYGLVMFGRAWARSLGFLFGAVIFLPNFIQKKPK